LGRACVNITIVEYSFSPTCTLWPTSRLSIFISSPDSRTTVASAGKHTAPVAAVSTGVSSGNSPSGRIGVASAASAGTGAVGVGGVPSTSGGPAGEGAAGATDIGEAVDDVGADEAGAVGTGLEGTAANCTGDGTAADGTSDGTAAGDADGCTTDEGEVTTSAGEGTAAGLIEIKDCGWGTGLLGKAEEDGWGASELGTTATAITLAFAIKTKKKKTETTFIVRSAMTLPQASPVRPPAFPANKIHNNMVKQR